MSTFKTSSDAATNMLSDPNAMAGMMKNNILNLFTMIVFGQWVNSTLAGFIVSKIYYTKHVYHFHCLMALKL